MEGIVTGATFGLGGALVGWLIARLIQKLTDDDKTPRWPSVLGVAIALVLMRPLLVDANKATASEVLAEMEAAEPVYVAIRTHEPRTYEALRQVVAEGIKQDKRPEIIRRDIQRVIAPLYEKRLPTAPDRELVKLAALVSDQAESLREKHPEVCLQLLGGGGIDGAQYLTPELNRRETDLLGRLLSSPPVVDGEKATDPQIERELLPIIRKIARDENVAEEVVAGVFENNGTPQLRCGVNAKLFAELSRLPEERGAPILRAMFAAGS